MSTSSPMLSPSAPMSFTENPEPLTATPPSASAHPPALHGDPEPDTLPLLSRDHLKRRRSSSSDTSSDGQEKKRPRLKSLETSSARGAVGSLAREAFEDTKDLSANAAVIRESPPPTSADAPRAAHFQVHAAVAADAQTPTSLNSPTQRQPSPNAAAINSENNPYSPDSMPVVHSSATVLEAPVSQSFLRGRQPRNCLRKDGLARHAKLMRVKPYCLSLLLF